MFFIPLTHREIANVDHKRCAINRNFHLQNYVYTFILQKVPYARKVEMQSKVSKLMRFIVYATFFVSSVIVSSSAENILMVKQIRS